MNSVPMMEEVVQPQPIPSETPSSEPLCTVIEPRSGWQFIGWAELWRFRELLYFLTWRDIKVRYKQTVLGIAWAFLQPAAAMLVFILFIGRLAGASASVPNYALFVFAGMLAWTFFSNAVLAAGNSVVSNERLVTKVYFPRLLVPMSAVGSALFDFLIGLLLLGGMVAWYGVVPQWELLLAPLFMGFLILAAIGVGTFLAALIVVQRDFRYVLHFGVQLWMFATPAIYLTAEVLGPIGQTWMPLNPAYGLILNFRQAILGAPLDWYAFGISAGVSVVLFVFGTYYFRRVERRFADVI